MPTISHVHLGSQPFIFTAVISNSSTHSSEQAILFLTQLNTPPPQACLSLLKFVKSVLNISVFPISSLSHDSVPIIMSGLYVSLNSRILECCCKYFCNLPVAKQVTCPHFCRHCRGLDFVPYPAFSLLVCIIHHLFFCIFFCLHWFQTQRRVLFISLLSGSFWYLVTELAPRRV